VIGEAAMTAPEEPKTPSADSHTESPSDSERAPPQLEILFLAIAGFVDLLVPAVVEGSRSPVVPAFLMGTVLGQFGLIATWAALGPQPPLSRLLRVLFGLASLHVMFLLGMVMASAYPGEIRSFALLMLFEPSVLLAAVFPPWILRMVGGRRLVYREARSVPSPARQFRLRQIMSFTALFAAVLGFAGLGVSLVSERIGVTPDVAWFGLAGHCVVAMVSSALIAIPIVWAAFIAQNRRAANIMVCGYASVAGLVLGATLSVLSPWPSSEIITGYLVLVTGAALILVGGLNIVRSSGYILARPGENSVIEPPEKPD
jgi:hypothetical protein